MQTGDVCFCEFAFDPETFTKLHVKVHFAGIIVMKRVCIRTFEKTISVQIGSNNTQYILKYSYKTIRPGANLDYNTVACVISPFYLCLFLSLTINTQLSLGKSA
jgi:hypothetical protein